MVTFTVRFTKRFTRGLLKDIKIYESLSFATLKAAEQWVKAIQSSSALEYVIEDAHYEVNK